MGTCFILMRKYLLLLALLIFSAIISVIFLAETSDRKPVAEDYSRILMRGISSKTRIAGDLVLEMAADEFRVSPRKFMVFNINIVNDALLSNAKFTIYNKKPGPVLSQPESIACGPEYFNYFSSFLDFTLGKSYAKFTIYDKKPGPVLSQPESIACVPENFNYFSSFLDFTLGKSKGQGIISKAIIKGVSIGIYNNDKLVFSIISPVAEIGLSNDRSFFYNVTLEHPSTKRFIYAKKIYWDNKDGRFIVPGIYKASSKKGKATGKGLAIDLGFNLIPLYAKNNRSSTRPGMFKRLRQTD